MRNGGTCILRDDMANILKEITADGSDIMNLTIAQAMANPKFGGFINKMLFGSKE